MRISELSAASGVPLPTVKYYLREGLLHPGEQLAATRAEYDETHLRRLRLIRALLEVGKLPVASIKKVIEAVDDHSLPVHTMLGTAHYALAGEVPSATQDPEWDSAQAEVDQLISAFGWRIESWAPPRAELTEILSRMRKLGMKPDLRPYAEAADKLVTEVEMNQISFDGPRDAAVEALVLGTILYGRAFDALRRLAQESESARRLAP
ncbi:MerR family transcriptional regulator [Nonomuraea typhae]|uniref:MerR family transcriptional regulator n=1 Tax=Nonomuraea typhae TaxID=2603600 RepID=A0ABW7YTN4_9ACTN